MDKTKATVTMTLQDYETLQMEKYDLQDQIRLLTSEIQEKFDAMSDKEVGNWLTAFGSKVLEEQCILTKYERRPYQIILSFKPRWKL